MNIILDFGGRFKIRLTVLVHDVDGNTRKVGIIWESINKATTNFENKTESLLELIFIFNLTFAAELLTFTF